MANIGELHQILMQEGEAFEKMIGRMSVNWADTEYYIYLVLLRYARISDPVGRAIFSGTRAKPMIDNITAILANTNAPKARREDFAYVAAQIGAIQTMRDLITHYATTGWGSSNLLGHLPKRLISDIARVRRKENAKVYPVDSAMIGHMCRDMRVIVTHLERHLPHHKGPFKPYGPPKPSAWLYKFPQPMARRASKTSKTPKQKRPQKPSRA